MPNVSLSRAQRMEFRQLLHRRELRETHLSLIAALAEFERDLPRERGRSGSDAPRQRGVVLGRRPGQHVKADYFAPRVLELVDENRSYREICPPTRVKREHRIDIVRGD
jgi:putative DNA-invertase from lambdoid prophage Rac